MFSSLGSYSLASVPSGSLVSPESLADRLPLTVYITRTISMVANITKKISADVSIRRKIEG